VKAVEPRGSIFEWGDLRNERFYLDRAGGEKFDGLGIFAGGGTGTLQSNLTADHFLQVDFYFGSEIADKSHGAAFADGVDAVGYSFSATDSFEDGVYADVVGEFENLLREIRFCVEDFSGAEIFRHFESRVIDVSDEDFLRAGGAQ